jgi:mannosyltransferase OCH1-like enzyme
MIPKIIHHCWFSGDQYPEKIKNCINSWGKYLPDYEIKLWDASNFNVNINLWTQEAYKKKKYAFIADYFRFWVLYNYGGIYLDSDVETIGTFENMLSNTSFFGFEYGQTPEAAIIGAEKGTPWLADCMEFYSKKHFILPDGNMCITSLPRHVLNIFKSKYKIELFDNEKIQEFDDLKLTIYPYYYFSPKNFYHYSTEKIEKRHETITIHHFNNSWCSKNGEPTWYKVHRITVQLLGKKIHGKILYYLRKLA